MLRFQTFNRLQHTSARRTWTLQARLKEVLRHSAQPVAVLTAPYPRLHHKEGSEDVPLYHGATLSSFTSISLHPLPIVAFSLRLPSRSADSIRKPDPCNTSSVPHLIINILSASQTDTAIKFSRADLHPKPFSDTRYVLSKEGIPILSGCIGALSCALLTSLPLYGEALTSYGISSSELYSCSEAAEETPDVNSELFIARVMRVEDNDASDDRLPLVYYGRRYSTIEPSTNSPSS
ncbi:flavin reductase like domain-containing protein [Cantharellus anzutake]|uniref:flavin reductase like domain-containing protein n=1 Tax=Cantharellus anzutake TaxID=1750568 RepID=UPI0019068986|nr:flavin reductase like domain-containing protein [Cantharellus anzutake]KAF8327144.1 flavin reductase like domain-containing protein [Cantharellus anzutake]